MNDTALPADFDPAGLEKPELNVGFVALSDCAPLVVAKEKGLFGRYGLEVTLSKETSWANVRDKVAVGILDAAQMLATMPIAATLGIGPIEKPMVTSLSLDLNGNAITVSEDLYRRLLAVDAEAVHSTPVTASALRALIELDAASGRPPLTFATVFPTSSHNYELRYWMAAAGIDPDRDVKLVVIPPPQMVAALRARQIDGFCVGEPWNQLAVREGLGRVLITKYELWNNSPEKVLGVSEEWALQNPNTHRALLMALLEAAAWVDRPENRVEVVNLIAQPRYVNAPRDVVRMSMLGTFQYARTEFARSLPDFNVFHRYAANFPWRSHAVWFITQMIRWGQLDRALDIRAAAERVYRPDWYRAAAAALGLAAPRADYKTEGDRANAFELDGITLGPDRFFDGGRFDPDDPVAYLRSQAVSRLAVPFDELSTLNPPRREAAAGRSRAPNQESEPK
jgi:nitrate/nitrite transport system substrate-binding protein